MTDIQPELNDDQRQVSRLIAPLYRSRRWMKCFAIVTVISAAFQCVRSMWYLLIIWLPIWMAYLVFTCASCAETAYLLNSERACLEAMEKLRIYFKLLVVAFLCGLLLAVVLGAYYIATMK